MNPKVGIYCRVGSKKQLGNYENVDIDLRDYIYKKRETCEEKYMKERRNVLQNSDNNILKKKEIIYDKEIVESINELYLMGFDKELVTNILNGMTLDDAITCKVKEIVCSNEIEVVGGNELFERIDFNKSVFANIEDEKNLLNALNKCKTLLQKSDYYKYDNYKWREDNINEAINLINKKEYIKNKYEGKFPLKEIEVLTLNDTIEKRKFDISKIEPIISPEEFSKVQEVLTQNKK